MLILSCLCFFSCTKGKVDPLDWDAGLNRPEVQKHFFKNPKHEELKKSQKESEKAPIPQISKLIATPTKPEIGGDKIISFSVTDQVPLKDVLIELGRVAKIDVDLDPSINGGIIINAKNRPFKEVIDRISSLGNLRYSYKNGVLFFEKDKPYLKNYSVEYITSSLWSDVEANLQKVINPQQALLQQQLLFQQQAQPTAILQNQQIGQTTNTVNNSQLQPVQNQQNIVPMQIGADIADNPSYYSSNKSAGIISVFATQKTHEVVKKYLEEVKANSSSQVLIEAKVVEVTLSKEFHSGINWTLLARNSGSTLASLSAGRNATDPLQITISKGQLREDLSGAVSALESFGTVRAIASPRIHAMNNQKANLDFTEKVVYFTINSSNSSSVNTGGGSGNSSTTASLTTQKNEMPIGTKLEITPVINIENNEITLNIKPELIVRGTDVSDPSINPVNGTSLGNKVPTSKIRTLNTTAKIQNGNVLVIGGLMTENASNSDSGIPFISRIPVIGWLFKNVSRKNEVIETVIFIKATVVHHDSLPNKNDRELHNKFTTDNKNFIN